MKKIIYTILSFACFFYANTITAQSLTCAGAGTAVLTENPTQGGSVTLGPFSNSGQSEQAFSTWTETANNMPPSAWNGGQADCAGIQVAVGQPVYFEFTPLFTAVYEFQVPGLSVQTNAQGNDVADEFCTSSVIDTEFAILSGTCGNLTEIYSVDDYGPSGACNSGGGCGQAVLTAGVTYTIVVDGAVYITIGSACTPGYATAGTSVGTFNIEITSALPGADCAAAIPLTVNSTCTTTTFSSSTTCPFASSCGGTNDDAAWFSFVANATDATIAVAGNDNVVEVFDGCGGASVGCTDDGGTTDTEVLSGLTIGATYYIFVEDFGTGTIIDNTICVTSSLVAPTCGTVTFEEENPAFTPAGAIDGNIYCETDDPIGLVTPAPAPPATATDPPAYGEYIQPGFYLVIDTDGFSDTENSLNISQPSSGINFDYNIGSFPENGQQLVLVWYTDNNTNITATLGDSFSDGAFPYTVTDLNGNFITSGTFDFGTTGDNDLSVTFQVEGSAIFSGTGVTNDSANGDGTGSFDPGSAGATYAGEDVDITYTWDNENGCTGNQVQTVTVFKEIVSTATNGGCTASITQDDASLTASYIVASDGASNGTTGAGFTFTAAPGETGTVTYTILNPTAVTAAAGGTCQTLVINATFACPAACDANNGTWVVPPPVSGGNSNQ